MAVDIRQLLSKKGDEIKAPPLWPVGTYYGQVVKFEGGESSQKKTPQLTVFIQITTADETIPQEQLTEIDFSKGRQFRKVYYLTDDALFRFNDFLKDIGIDTDGRSLFECAPEMVGKPVQVTLEQQAPQNGGENLFNVLGDKILKAPE